MLGSLRFRCIRIKQLYSLRPRVQIMSCHFIGTKPLYQPVPDYWCRTLRNKLQWNVYQCSYIFTCFTLQPLYHNCELIMLFLTGPFSRYVLQSMYPYIMFSLHHRFLFIFFCYMLILKEGCSSLLSPFFALFMCCHLALWVSWSTSGGRLRGWCATLCINMSPSHAWWCRRCSSTAFNMVTSSLRTPTELVMKVNPRKCERSAPGMYCNPCILILCFPYIIGSFLFSSAICLSLKKDAQVYSHLSSPCSCAATWHYEFLGPHREATCGVDVRHSA